MSKPHHELRAVKMNATQRVPYFKPRSKISIFCDRLVYNVRYSSRHWKDRIIVRAASALLLYTLGLYAITIKYYGKDHPLNRYQWKRMKKNGQLSEEMLHKEEVFQNYMRSRLNFIYEKEPIYSLKRPSTTL